MNQPLTAEELTMLDNVRTAAEHRAACDKVKDARDGHYPDDWYEKMIQSGKTDEIARRYSAPGGITTKAFSTLEELFASLRS